MHAHYISQSEIPEGFAHNNVQKVIVVGGCLPDNTMLRLKKLMPNADICPRYGLTEVGKITSYNPKNPREKHMLSSKLGSCGRPVKGITCRIVDVKTEKNLSFNQPGEIRILSKSVMNGHYKMDSSSSFDSEGWLRTGDVAYYDEDFCFFYVERIKELLIYKGVHVPPACVERVLLTHPAVKEAVVFGIPHEVDGDVPAALVVLKNNLAAADTEDIRKYVNERVYEFNRLHGGLKVVEKLYYTPTMKVRRNYMKQLYLQEKL